MARRIIFTADENSDRLKKHNNLEQADSGISVGLERPPATEDMKSSEAADGKGSEIADIDNARLIEALQQYDNELLEQFFAESDDEPPVSISPEGRRKMKDTLAPWLGADRAELLVKREEQASNARIKAWKHKKRARLAKRAVRWSATAAVVLLMVMSGNYVGNDAMAFKVPNIGYISEKQADHSKFKTPEANTFLDSDKEKMDGITTVYVLTECIEGCELKDKITTADSILYVYANSGNKNYQFSQFVLDSGIGVNTEMKDYKKIDSSFGDAYYVEYKSTKSLFWNYNGYSFSIEGNISKEELLFLQKSIRREE